MPRYHVRDVKTELLKYQLKRIMENNTGWVKLYRKIFDNPYMNKPTYLSVWIWILSHAEHGKKLVGKKWIDKSEEEMPSIIWKGKRRYLKRGEFTFGEHRIAKDTGIPRPTVHRILFCFVETEHQIEIERSNKFSVGIVLNWDKYQQNEQQNEQQMNIKRTSNEHVAKNDKNVEKKTYVSPEYLLSIPSEDIEQLSKDMGISEFTIKEKGKSLFDYCEAKGKQYKNYKAFLRNCLRKDTPKSVINYQKESVDYETIKPHLQ